jgi:hypothetical protein
VVPLPRPVCLDWLRVEISGPDLVETTIDQHRYPTAAQSEPKRFLGAQEGGRNRQVEVEIRQLGAELARLRSASRRQAHGASRIAAHHTGDVGGRFCVPRDNKQTDRFMPPRSCATIPEWVVEGAA